MWSIKHLRSWVNFTRCLFSNTSISFRLWVLTVRFNALKVIWSYPLCVLFQNNGCPFYMADCNILFEFLPCALLILCFVSMISFTHAGIISYLARTLAKQLRFNHQVFSCCISYKQGRNQDFFGGTHNSPNALIPATPLPNVPTGEITVSRSVLTVYSCFEKGCRKKCARDNHER